MNGFRRLDFLRNSKGEALDPFEKPPKDDVVQRLGVFLSHRGDDTKIILVKPIADILKHEYRIPNVFFDRDQPSGTVLSQNLVKAIYQCSVVVIVASDRFPDSDICIREANTAIQRYNQKDGVRLVPVLYQVGANDERFRTLKSVVFVQNLPEDANDRFALSVRIIEQVLIKLGEEHNSGRILRALKKREFQQRAIYGGVIVAIVAAIAVALAVGSLL